MNKIPVEDKRVTYLKIEETLDLNATAIYTILTDHLDVLKLCWFWQHSQIEDQKIRHFAGRE